MKIGLLDHLGGGNLGDDATLEAVRQNLRTRLPAVEIVGFTMNPEDTQRRHGIAAYPIRRQTWTLGAQALFVRRVGAEKVTFKQGVRALLNTWPPLLNALQAIYAGAVALPVRFLKDARFLSKSFRHVRMLDALIVSGGGQLLDWGGPLQFPYTLFTWVLLARLAHVKCVFLNVGAGPLKHALSRRLIRRALLWADYVSFRDEQSRALATSIGFKRSADVFPDCVYALEHPFLETARPARSTGPSVGIAPMPFCDPRSYYPEKNQLLYDNFISALGSFGSWLAENHYAVTLLCTDIGVDPPAMEDVRNSGVLNAARRLGIAQPSIRTIGELLAVISSLDYLVTCRFHGVVFAHLVNVPVLALSHHPKIDTLMSELGMAEFCVNIHTADCGVLRKAFESLVRDREEIKHRMVRFASLYKTQLGGLFDFLGRAMTDRVPLSRTSRGAV